MTPSLQKKKDRKVVENFPCMTKSSVLDIIIITIIVAIIVGLIYGIYTGTIDLSLLMLFK